jgi:putative hemolysin
MAIVASRRGRLRSMADAGDAAARTALDLASNPDRFLPTVQVGVTLVGTLAAAYGGERMVDSLAAWLAATWPGLAAVAQPVALAAFVFALSFVTLVLGELVPKRLALRNAESFARVAAPLVQWLSRLAAPLVWGLNLGTAAVLFLLGARGKHEQTVSVDDIEQLLETGRAEGVLEAVEQAVATEALRLGERTVRDVMRPRIEIDALDVDTPSDEIIGAIAMAGYSRLTGSSATWPSRTCCGPPGWAGRSNCERCSGGRHSCPRPCRSTGSWNCSAKNGPRSRSCSTSMAAPTAW